MAQGHTTTAGALAGQEGQAWPLELNTSGDGRSPGQEANLLGSRPVPQNTVSGSSVDGHSQIPGQWSLAARGLARRDWVGRCVHCSGSLVVTIKTTPSGRDVCRVSPYDGHWDRDRSRSRTRSPTPILSPVRSVRVEGGLPGQSQGLDGEATEVQEHGTQLDMDTRLLEFLG